MFLTFLPRHYVLGQHRNIQNNLFACEASDFRHSRHHVLSHPVVRCSHLKCRGNLKSQTPLSRIQLFMPFKFVVSADQEANLSLFDYKKSCYFWLWFLLPHKLMEKHNTETIICRIQVVMSFRGVVSAHTICRGYKKMTSSPAEYNIWGCGLCSHTNCRQNLNKPTQPRRNKSLMLF